MPSTRSVYERIAWQIDTDDPVGWLEKEISKRQPIGTLLPKKAVAKHIMISQLGLSEEEVDSLLPKLKGKKGKIRRGLTPQQVQAYYIAVQSIHDPVRTILLLIPLTGLRISEICQLRTSDIEQVGNHRLILRFAGKGEKERIVPLSKSAEQILRGYIERDAIQEGWIFPSPRGSHLSPVTVRRYTRQMAVAIPTLSTLSPHVLRHTFATQAMRDGVNLRSLQALLGHENISTTSRYLHPDTEDLFAAVDQMGKK